MNDFLSQNLPPASCCPANGQSLPPVAWSSPEDVARAVQAARKAQESWAAAPLSARIAACEALARRILENRHDISAIIAQETGKSFDESLLSEVAGVLEYARVASKEARHALKPTRVAISPAAYPGKRAVVEAVPRGVVGIIAPWNYPLSIFFKPMFPALLSGCALVLKPSEYTPRTGAWLARQCEGLFPTGLVQVVQGPGEIGQALVEAEIDALTFTGSVATGRKIAARAAERLIPCSVELGGKDAAIVLADCDLERTAAGIAQWSMHNAGQNCAGIERVYVEEALANAFVERLGALVSRLRVNTSVERGAPPSDLGPLQNHQQMRIVQAHVADALQKGATLVTGGKPTGTGLGFAPTVLDHCTHEMLAVTEETFGPVVAIIRVRDAEEAIVLANDSHYGLSGSVWTRDVPKGERLARRLHVGMALVNNHCITGTMANIPWTGVRDTGTGVAASRFSYETFVRPRTVFVDTSSKPDPWWAPANADTAALGEALAAYSLKGISAILGLAKVAGRRAKAVQVFARGTKG